MNEKSVKNTYEEFCKVDKMAGSLYQTFQKKSGLSDSEFWCMAAVANYGYKYPTQICSDFYMSKQTVSHALKQLSAKGFVELKTNSENMRLKEIVLTSKGIEFSKKHINIVAEAEKSSWNRLDEHEQLALIEFMRKLNELFKEEIDNIFSSAEDENE